MLLHSHKHLQPGRQRGACASTVSVLGQPSGAAAHRQQARKHYLASLTSKAKGGADKTDRPVKAAHLRVSAEQRVGGWGQLGGDTLCSAGAAGI